MFTEKGIYNICGVYLVDLKRKTHEDEHVEKENRTNYKRWVRT